jgi:hypothetical protein
MAGLVLDDEKNLKGKNISFNRVPGYYLSHSRVYYYHRV